MHDFGRDFYGAILKICVVGYLRPEKNFTSLDKLIETIKQDIENANVALDLPESIKLKDDSFFTDQWLKILHHKHFYVTIELC